MTAFREGMAVHGRYQKLSRVRHAGAAHSVCGQRDELLRALSDRWPPARRPGDVPAPQADWPRTPRSSKHDDGPGDACRVARVRAPPARAGVHARGGRTAHHRQQCASASGRGRRNYPAWLDAIAAARHTVHFETYIIWDDASGATFADALSAKARDGVQVRVLYDWLGAIGKTPQRFWVR